MPSFKINSESSAQVRKTVKWHPELAVGAFLARIGWTYPEFMLCPNHIIEQISWQWHLETVAENERIKAQNKANKGK